MTNNITNFITERNEEANTSFQLHVLLHAFVNQNDDIQLKSFMTMGKPNEIQNFYVTWHLNLDNDPKPRFYI